MYCYALCHFWTEVLYDISQSIRLSYLCDVAVMPEYIGGNWIRRAMSWKLSSTDGV